MICHNCGGDGWYIDHSDRHYQTGDAETCEEAGCPIQRLCECGRIKSAEQDQATSMEESSRETNF